MSTLGGPVRQPRRSRRLVVLGSTGSIGTATMDVVAHLESDPDFQVEIVGLATGTNAATLARQAKRFNVEHVALANNDTANALADCKHVYTGPDAARELVNAVVEPGDLVIGAIVGSAGIPAILAAIEQGADIALANKETLVAAGELVIPALAENDCEILPVDSEHSAVFQCLRAGRSIEEVRRLVLTASGGPFRNWSQEQIQNATVEQALNHPTWKMGPKVTIDSASLMNKALEIIEAHWLFGLNADQIEVIVHPQSIVHSFVEFIDGSVIAQLGPPDMKLPIQYAITWPKRLSGCAPTMAWNELTNLEFESVDRTRFPAVDIAYEVIETGGTSGTVFNAANEVAVEAFLAGAISFGSIVELVQLTMESLPSTPVRTMNDINDADREARAFVVEHLAAKGVRFRSDTYHATSEEPPEHV